MRHLLAELLLNTLHNYFIQIYDQLITMSVSPSCSAWVAQTPLCIPWTSLGVVKWISLGISRLCWGQTFFSKENVRSENRAHWSPCHWGLCALIPYTHLKVCSHPGRELCFHLTRENDQILQLKVNSQEEVWLQINGLATTSPAPQSPVHVDRMWNSSKRH